MCEPSRAFYTKVRLRGLLRPFINLRLERALVPPTGGQVRFLNAALILKYGPPTLLLRGGPFKSSCFNGYGFN
jgi:hypothetical protein